MDITKSSLSRKRLRLCMTKIKVTKKILSIDITKSSLSRKKLKVGATKPRLLRKIKQRYDKKQGCQKKIK